MSQKPKYESPAAARVAAVREWIARWKDAPNQSTSNAKSKFDPWHYAAVELETLLEKVE